MAGLYSGDLAYLFVVGHLFKASMIGALPVSYTHLLESASSLVTTFDFKGVTSLLCSWFDPGFILL